MFRKASALILAFLSGGMSKSELADHMRDLDELFPGLGWRSQADAMTSDHRPRGLREDCIPLRWRHATLEQTGTTPSGYRILAPVRSVDIDMEDQKAAILALESDALEEIPV